jgi:hypothetical protein
MRRGEPGGREMPLRRGIPQFKFKGEAAVQRTHHPFVLMTQFGTSRDAGHRRDARRPHCQVNAL